LSWFYISGHVTYLTGSDSNTVRLSPPRPQFRGWTPCYLVQKSSVFLLTEPYWDTMDDRQAIIPLQLES
jgi:hypothetical protein